MNGRSFEAAAAPLWTEEDEGGGRQVGRTPDY